MDKKINPNATDSAFLKMPWTIEHQLKAYSEDPRHTERHETLYWSWKQLSRWLANLLNYVITSFQTYSKHDETHCRAVLHNIELLLGEDEIRRLSPTDCFGILIAVYLHDIGMCVSNDDKAEIISSDSFYYSIEEMEESSDPELREAAHILKETDYRIETKSGKPDEIRDNFKELYQKKLGVYQAVTLLLGEHSRGFHARASKDKVYEWVKNSDQSQSGFAMTGIPRRIFLQLAECARLHNDASSFKDIAKSLLTCDNGYAYDQYHPRFIAVLLMLGDALDVDNNRFNPFVKEMAGKSFTNRSEIHFQKHMAIRALQINPKLISIQADCTHTDELRLLRSDFDWLEGFLQDCNYHWGEIAPDNFQGCLPALSFDKIRLEGQEIPSDLVSSKFLISQRKAFRLLQGANLYDNRFVFLRELLQNAMDATKRQYWTELEIIETNSSDAQELVKANNILPLKRYPIHIDFQIKKRKKGSNEPPIDITSEDFRKQPIDFHQQYELGVLVLIQDSGVGISQEDIRAISEVGTSHDRDRDIVLQMPEWLRPNGRFGIGLQSVFLVDDTFQCITRTRQDECYKIILHSGATGDGHIDVIPYNGRDSSRGKVPYGTSFSVFVPESYREDRSKNDTGWIGADPYDIKYQVWSGIRGAAELMRQMEHYLDSQIGEWIFPVILREFPLHPSLKNIREKVFPQKELLLEHAIRQPICEEDYVESEWVPLRENGGEWSNWLFRESRDSDCLQDQFKLDSADADTGAYRIEVRNGRIKIWSQKTQCFFCCSPARILNFGRDRDGALRKNGDIRIYVKGLFVSEIEYPGNELLGYIDIESDELQEGLQMDRDSLNEKGKALLSQKIIPELLQTFYGILQNINRKIDEAVQNHQQYIIHRLEDEYSHILKEYIESAEERKRILSSFKIRLSKLSRQNYVLFELLCKGQLDQARAELASSQNDLEGDDSDAAVKQLPIGGVLRTAYKYKNEKAYAPKDAADGFHLTEQIDADCLFSNDLISIIDNDDYVAFEQKNAPKEGNPRRQRMIRALYDAAKYSEDTENDYVTIFLTDFLKRLDDILALITVGTTNGKDRTELWQSVNEQRQDTVRKLSNELQGYVLLYGMFFFYVNQGNTASCSECVHEDDRPCYWRFINDKIADILIYAIGKLRSWNPEEDFSKDNAEFSKNAELFQKALYVRGVEEQTPGIIGYYSVAEILKNENHFAVFSTRQTSQDTWKHLLIHLAPFGNRYLDYKLASPELTVFDLLNTVPNSPNDCVERWAFLDQWNADMIESMRKEHILGRLNESAEDKMLNLDIWGSGRVWWMIHHYPTLSLGADKEGNNRINVLGPKANTHVFVDARSVLLLMNRAKECASKMTEPRFQTIVWDGFASLKIKEVSNDVMTINRGVLSDENKKNIMFLGLPYHLPQQARLPYDKTNPRIKPRTLEDIGVSILPQLLDYIREVYNNPGEKNWDTLEQQAIINQCETIVSFLPLDSKSEDSLDWKMIRWVQACYKNQVPEPDWDRSLVVEDHSALLETLQGIFEACIIELLDSIRQDNGQFTPCTSWAKMDLPINRKSYVGLFLFKAYNLDQDAKPYPYPEELAGYFSDIETSVNKQEQEEKFEKITQKLCYALVYCAYYAEEEYRTAFLKDICAWWKEEIWENDPGKKIFLQKSAEQTGMQPDELERIYMAQVRRIICSVLSGTESYLEAIKELNKAKAIINSHLPQNLKAWLQETTQKMQRGDVC